MDAAKLRVRLPEASWPAQLTRVFPDVVVTVHHHLPVTGGGLALVRLRGPNLQDAVAWLRSAPGVLLVEEVHTEPDERVLRVQADQAPLLAALQEAQVLPQTPFQVRQGEADWFILAPRPHLQKLVHALKAHGAGVQLRGITAYAGRSLLTTRQQEFLDTAIRLGYYDYPRRINLTGLATALRVSKSTLSEALMGIERHVMGGFTDPL